MDNVTPAAFKDRWETVLETWGHQMHSALTSVLQMLETAVGLEPDYLVRASEHGSAFLSIPYAARLITSLDRPPAWPDRNAA